MNYSIIRYISARVLEFAGLFLLLPVIVGVIYKEKECLPYLVIAVLCLLTGAIVKKFGYKSKVFYAREGFVTVSVSWILLSVIGAIPFVITGEIPSYVDALFETVSGLTTTGGTVLEDVEVLSRCSQFWRMFTHWIGGMGVLVFVLAVLPLSGSHNIHLMRAESTGATVGKLVPRVKNTAQILYLMYIGFTVLCTLLLIIAKLPVYDAIVMTFSAVGTGGFGILNSSVAGYSVLVQSILLVFMFLCGISFNIYYLFLIKKPKEALRNEELRTYFIIVALATVLVAINIKDITGGMGKALYQALFHVVSVITTTGFCITDYNLWPDFSKVIILFILIVGACAGSTGGGMKISRLVVLLKSIKNEIVTALHPRSVKKMHMDGKVLSEEVVRSIRVYFVVYMVICFGSVLLISVDNLGFETNMTAVMALLSNVGPGFDQVGPVGNYSSFSAFSKFVLMFDMLAGRLELFPILILFAKGTWKK